MQEKNFIVMTESSSDLGENLTIDELTKSKVVYLSDPRDVVSEICSGNSIGLYVPEKSGKRFFDMIKTVYRGELIENLPIGIVLVDECLQIVHSNRQFHLWCEVANPEEKHFYEALGFPELAGPDFCPFHLAVSERRAAETEMKNKDNLYYDMTVYPIFETQDDERPISKPAKLKFFSVVLRDITAVSLLNQKLALLQEAGAQLADLSPEELLLMSVEERIELLKANIIQSTKDILHYDVMEIRLLAHESGRLEPLLAVGMEEEAINRELYASPQGNGVTGFVAYTGKSYLCEDTQEDLLYLHGSAGAKSSLTVPLKFREEIIGTLNIESPKPRAFDQNDLQFLDILSRAISGAIHTLELLSAEKTGTALASTEAIHRAVAIPVNQIFRAALDIVNSSDLNVTPEVRENLNLIEHKAREIRDLVLRVGERFAPIQAHPEDKFSPLMNRRILVVDPDETMMLAANDLLIRYHCEVDGAPTSEQAIQMAKRTHYDAIISDIRPPDMNGYHLLLKLRETLNTEYIPLILMKGFGYDADHVVVNARQAGAKLFISKPFLLPQFLTALEHAVNRTEPGPK